ncbi:hypothetical protein C2857_005609 [Epichloe festucae Fl1]|uniref:Uncharacterized protein n=1 Tax=Epichloe festucae (strain Fl1) TaxID=877507 RepID=A0A7S9PSE4_EPIFF|nr:hypothetical protein C2857_005609 [Epichloe festucae Fl1]
MPKRPLQRPLISAPLGPVKTSRGPYLVRSEGFELVDSIEDCESAPATPTVSVASRRSRRISASFLSTAVPSTSPIVAESNINAVTHIQSTKGSKGTFSRRPALLSLSTRSLLKQPSRYTLVARTSPVEDDENVTPLGVRGDQGVKPYDSQKMGGKLPRSRTMTVLHGLKKSFSRPSLAAVRNSGFENKMTPRKTPSIAKESNSASSPLTSSSSSSETTPTPTSHAAPASNPATPQPDVRYIDTAQSSEYWSGRFMALQDRFLSENLDDDCLSLYSSRVDKQWREPKLAALGRQSLTTTSRNRLTYLAPSNTTSALTTITYNPRRRLDEQDDARCCRIFSHLDSLCSTTEAKKSLRSWQQAYARRLGCPKLLSMEGKMHNTDRKNMLLGSVGSRLKSIERQGIKVKEMPSPVRGAFAIKLASSRGVAVC